MTATEEAVEPSPSPEVVAMDLFDVDISHLVDYLTLQL